MRHRTIDRIAGPMKKATSVIISILSRMCNSLVTMALVMLVLALSMATASPASQNKELRAGASRIIAVQLIELNWKTEQEFTRFFTELKEKGVNTVIMRLFQNAGPVDRRGKLKYRSGIYFKSDHAPLMTDLLGPACKAARATGISLFGWMTTRHCDWFTLSNREWQDERYNLDRGKKEFYPRLDIFHPTFRKEITGLFHDLAGYDLDGILIQDDCVLRYNEAFSIHARQAYYRETGNDLDAQDFFLQTVRLHGKTYVSKYSSRFYTWRTWKIDKLFEFVTELGLVSKKKRPGLKLAMNFYYEALTAPAQARTWYSHDLERARNCPIDIFSFMAYHRQMASELNKSSSQTIDMLHAMTDTVLTEIGDPARILMKLQVRDWKSGKMVNLSEIIAAQLAVNQHPALGITFVPYSRALDLERVLSTMDIIEQATRP